MTVFPCELGQPPLVIKIGVDRSLDLHGVEEEGDEFGDGEGREGAPAVIVDLVAKSLESVLGNLETISLAAKSMTLPPDVGDVPTSTEIGFGWSRHGCLLPNKNRSCW
jgi:hypothetical protein